MQSWAKRQGRHLAFFHQHFLSHSKWRFPRRDSALQSSRLGRAAHHVEPVEKKLLWQFVWACSAGSLNITAAAVDPESPTGKEEWGWWREVSTRVGNSHGCCAVTLKQASRWAECSASGVAACKALITTSHSTPRFLDSSAAHLPWQSWH